MTDQKIFEKNYDSQKIEKEIQKYWELNKQFKTIENDPNYPKGKFYACSMLPYPSGRLHMGHVRNYTINDVMARWKRMMGYNVLMPMGWDAFGLPAENAALAKNLSPSEWTYSNIATMKKQLISLGLAIDWSREITTCSADYYKWNQWLFLRMLEKGIAYKKTGTVNWDPKDKTVLANEQVIDGFGWRSGVKVEKREIPMYYLAITKYSKQLVQGLEKLEWPDRVKTMQENWIGRSSGLQASFKHSIFDDSNTLISNGLLDVYTTRPDTIMGVTFVAIAPEHPISSFLTSINPQVELFVNNHKSALTEAEIATREKAGINTQLSVEHPLTKEKIPLWISNYVIMSYGNGAVMGVPAHDERDFEFAKKYKILIKQVIQPKLKSNEFDVAHWKEWYSKKENCICINSGKYSGLDRNEAVKKIISDVEKLNLGKRKTETRLRDWAISRQRYWGTPIPIIHCNKCGSVSVPDDQLPVTLPENITPDGSGNPLLDSKNFIETNCPKCGGIAKRETDTMDTFIDSSWYFLRYCCFDSQDKMVDSRVDYWLPMDQYIGGIEHAVLHLLYARFWIKVMNDLGLIEFREPFKNLLTQGMVLNQTFYKKDKDGKQTFYNPDEIKVKRDKRGKVIGAFLSADKSQVLIGGSEKMSKSKNNGVDPESIILKYGADTARIFTIFASPPQQSLEWSGNAIEGSYKFLKRLWNFCYTQSREISADTIKSSTKLSGKLKNSFLRRKTHEILRQASYDMDRQHYNTVVSACMKLLNSLEENTKKHLDNKGQTSMLEKPNVVMVESLSILIRILYPIAPHITEYLWNKLGFVEEYGNLISTKWPDFDQQALEHSQIEMVLQINGKVRSKLSVKSESTNEEITKIAINSDAYKRYSQGRIILKTIIVPKRLINLVLKEK